MEYQVRLATVRTPFKWGKGEWEKDEESLGGYKFTGKDLSEFKGYRLCIIAIAPDGKEKIIESIPRYGEVLFDNVDDAREYVESGVYASEHNPTIKFGQEFTPFTGGQSGVITDGIQ